MLKVSSDDGVYKTVERVCRRGRNLRVLVLLFGDYCNQLLVQRQLSDLNGSLQKILSVQLVDHFQQNVAARLLVLDAVNQFNRIVVRQQLRQ